MKEKFKELQDKWPNLSSLLIFGRFIRMTPGEDWNTRKITSWFNKLVDKEDYLKREKKFILNFLVQKYGLTTRGQMSKIGGKRGYKQFNSKTR